MKPTRTASARIVLALAVAALVLGGCGGGSSDNSSSSSTSADTASSGAPSSGASSSDGASNTASSDASGGPGSAASGANEGAAAGGGSGAGGGQPSTGGKQGSHVPQPKGAPEPGITPQQRQEATVASMTLQSPSSQASSGGPQMLPAEYTCDGKNTSPALRWQGVPEGTAELVLFVMNVQPVGGKLFFDWAVARLSPELKEIEAGKLPKGAVAGRNSFDETGYKICPEGKGETYMFTLFALPKKLSLGQSFEPLFVRKMVTDISGNVGLLALGYARG